MKDKKLKERIEMEELKKAIKDNEVVLLLLPHTAYLEKVINVTKMISSMSERICFVTLNRPYKTLVKEFKKNEINLNPFFFIDCVTKKVKEEEGDEQVAYVSSPRALTEMNIVMKKVLETGSIEIAIFDSLSTLLVYEDPHVVVKFAHSVISMFRTLGSKGVIISLKEDMESELIKDLNMFVDKVVEMD